MGHNTDPTPKKKEKKKKKDSKVKDMSLTSLKLIHPDFALHQSHLSCQGQQRPKRIKVMMSAHQKTEYPTMQRTHSKVPRSIT